MTANPIDVAIVDGVAVAKSNLRGYEKLRVRKYMATPTELRNTSLSGQFAGVYVRSLQTFFDLDTSDTTTADDGVNCIIDFDGNRFKLVVYFSYNGRTGGVTAIGTDVPLRSYLAGLTLSTAGSSATFGIAAGVATNSTNVSMMSLANAITKTTSAWVVGSGNGSLDTGSIAANTWYHVHLMTRPDTGVTDVATSLSATAPTTGGSIPSAYMRSRRIGSMKTNGASQWVLFHQLGDEFLWDIQFGDVVSFTATTTPASRTLVSVPLGIQVGAILNGVSGGSGSASTGLLIYSLDAAASTVANNNTQVLVTTAGSYQGFAVTIRTNVSQQVGMVSVVANIIVNANVAGWIDRRGRDL